MPEGAAAPHPAPAGVLASLRLRDFRLLWLNAFLTWFGAGFNLIALQHFTIETLRAAGREADVVRAVGLLPFFGLLPLFLFSVFSGALADRLDRRRLLLTSQALRLVVAAGLVLAFWTGHLTIGAAYALNFALGTTQAVVLPTRHSLVPGLVPRDHLLNAVSLINLAQQASMILGPVTAGFVIRAAGVGPSFAAHAVLLAGAIVPLVPLRAAAPRVRTAADGPPGLLGILHEVRTGLRDCWRNRILRALLFTTALSGLFFIGPFTALVPLLARNVYGSDVSGQGILQGVLGIGMIAGSLFIARRHDLTGMGWKMVAAIGAGGILWALIGTIPVMSVGLVLLLLWGAGGGIFFNLNLTLTQREVDDDMRGRVMSIVTLFTQGCVPVGNLVATALATAIGAGTTVALGVQHTFQIAGLCTAAGALALVVSRARVLRLD